MNKIHKRIKYTCQLCGKPDETIASHVKFCPDCRPQAKRNHHKVPKITKICGWCDNSFIAVRKNQINCSLDCCNESMNELIRGTRRFLESIKLSAGCIDCGYNLHPEALDFDHVQGEKLFILAKAKRITAKLIEEIEKCDVRCANCHRIRTKERRDNGTRECRVEFRGELRRRSTLLSLVG